MNIKRGNDLGKLEGKIALITGGGTGIGKQIAGLFSREGAVSIICGRREKIISQAALDIQNNNGKCEFIVCDIGDPLSVKTMFESIDTHYGRLDILVNNASVVGQVAPIEEIDPLMLEETSRINITGFIMCCSEAVRRMKARSSGNIINISSNVGRRGFKNRTPYVAGKWAMQGLTQTIALETASYGIRCNAICPGPVMTGRLEASIKIQAAARSIGEEELISEWKAQSPMGRFATADECASLALFLASDDSSCMTGQTLDATCGVLMN